MWFLPLVSVLISTHTEAVNYVKNYYVLRPIPQIFLDAIYRKGSVLSSIDKRMEDQEVTLRLICFYRYYTEDASLNNYNGNMEITLDDATEILNKLRSDDLRVYVNLFSRAMQNATYLFGRYAFRKIMLRHLQLSANKQLINKALFVSWSVLLTQFEPPKIQANYSAEVLAELLAYKMTKIYSIIYLMVQMEKPIYKKHLKQQKLSFNKI
jgi:hypothetical protein